MAHVEAVCCEISNKPGMAHTTTLGGHLEQKLKCAHCGKEYSVDYNQHDLTRIPEFESGLKIAAQRALDDAHPIHGNYVNVVAELPSAA